MARETKSCRRYDSPGDAHYLTFSCYGRQPLLRSPRLCHWLAEAIEAARRRHGFALWGYVFMPEHVHLLLMPQQPQYSVSAILHAIKSPVAHRAPRHLKATHSPLLVALQSIDSHGWVGYHLWQPGGGYDRNLSSPKAIHAALEYMHNNPVRRGLTSLATEWSWSSCGDWTTSEQGHIRIDRTLPTYMP